MHENSSKSEPSSPVKVDGIEIPEQKVAAVYRLASNSSQSMKMSVSLKQSNDSLLSSSSKSSLLAAESIIPANAVALAAFQLQQKIATPNERSYAVKTHSNKEIRADSLPHTAFERSHTAHELDPKKREAFQKKEVKAVSKVAKVSAILPNPHLTTFEEATAVNAHSQKGFRASTPDAQLPSQIIDKVSQDPATSPQRATMQPLKRQSLDSPNSSLRISINAMTAQQSTNSSVLQEKIESSPGEVSTAISTIVESPTNEPALYTSQSNPFKIDRFRGERKSTHKASRIASLSKDFSEYSGGLSLSNSKLPRDLSSDFSINTLNMPNSNSQSSLSSPLFMDLKSKRASAIIIDHTSMIFAEPTNLAVIRKKRVEDIMGGACSILGGTPKTLEILEDLYVKACEEGRVLLSGISRKMEEGSGKNDAITLLFGYFFNTSRRMCEICASCISVVDIKARILDVSKLQRQFRSDDAGEIVVYVQAIEMTVRALEDLVLDYGRTEKRLLIIPADGFRIEVLGDGQESVERGCNWYEESKLEHVDEDADYFRKHFSEDDCRTYVGIMEKIGPVIISIKIDNQISNTDTTGIPTAEEGQWRAILRMKESVDIRALIPSVYNKKDKHILPMIHPQIVSSRLIKVPDTDKSVKQRLISLDEMKLVRKYKFGVLYCKDNQNNENDMFGNEHPSAKFSDFLKVLGNTVSLNGFTGYRAGLDTEHGQTGEETINLKWRGFEITYHVSTMLPYFKGDLQQIQRKRHIGNDIVCIVFLEGEDTQFDPTSVRSQFLHVFIVIKADRSSGVDGYKVMVTSNSDVPVYGPSLTTNGIFYHPAHLRDFLLSKMINGENAAYYAPKFQKPHVRTRNAIIDDFIGDFCKKEYIEKANRERDEQQTNSPSVVPESSPTRRGSLMMGQLSRKFSIRENSGPPPDILSPSEPSLHTTAPLTGNASIPSTGNSEEVNKEVLLADDTIDENSRKPGFMKRIMTLKIRPNSVMNLDAPLERKKTFSKSTEELSAVPASPIVQEVPNPLMQPLGGERRNTIFFKK